MSLSLGYGGEEEVVVKGVLIEWQHCAFLGLTTVDVAYPRILQSVTGQYFVLALPHQLVSLVELCLHHRPLLGSSYAVLFLRVHPEVGRELFAWRQEGIQVTTHYNVILWMTLSQLGQGSLQLFDLRLILDCF